MDKNKSDFLAAKGLSNVPPAGVVGGTSNFLHTCDHAGVKFFADKKLNPLRCNILATNILKGELFFLTNSEKLCEILAVTAKKSLQSGYSGVLNLT